MRRYVQVGLLGGIFLILQWSSVLLHQANSDWAHALALLIELPFWLFGALGYGILLVVDVLLAGGRLPLPPMTSPILTVLDGNALGPVVLANVGQLVVSTGAYGLILDLARHIAPQRRERVGVDLMISCSLAVLVAWLHTISNLFQVGQRAAGVGVFPQGLLLQLLGLSLPDSLLTADLRYQYFLWDTVALMVASAAIIFVIIRVARHLRSRLMSQPRNATPPHEGNRVGVRTPHVR